MCRSACSGPSIQRGYAGLLLRSSVRHHPGRPLSFSGSPPFQAVSGFLLLRYAEQVHLTSWLPLLPPYLRPPFRDVPAIPVPIWLWQLPIARGTDVPCHGSWQPIQSSVTLWLRPSTHVRPLSAFPVLQSLWEH